MSQLDQAVGNVTPELFWIPMLAGFTKSCGLLAQRFRCCF
mgnify:CR=1 FL=1